MCTCMYVWVYSCMCTCMEIGSRCWMPSSVILHFYFGDLDFNKPGVFCSSWSLTPWDLPVSMPPVMGCKCMLLSPADLPVSMPPNMGCRCMLPPLAEMPVSMPPAMGYRSCSHPPAFTWALGIWNQVISMLVHQTLDPLSHLSRI